MQTVPVSCFSDEVEPRIREQLTAAATLMRRVTLRSGSFAEGTPPKNITKWEPAERAETRRLLAAFGLTVAELGGPIGKIKLHDVEDGTQNRFVPWEQYLGEVDHAIALAVEFGTRRLRGFSFYPPASSRPEDHLPLVIDRLRTITERCAAAGIVYGCEVEANLVGRDGQLCAELAKGVNHPHFRLVFDAGNLTCQNMLAPAVHDHFVAMLPWLGWMHIKDYRIDPSLVWKGWVDEHRLKNFVPCDVGDSGYEAIFRTLRIRLPALNTELSMLGIDDGVLCTLEPHLTGGGPTGGKSGPQGMGLAMRGFLSLLRYCHLRTGLSTYEDVQALRDATP